MLSAMRESRLARSSGPAGRTAVTALPTARPAVPIDQAKLVYDEAMRIMNGDPPVKP
jgi:hypothetical protein